MKNRKNMLFVAMIIVAIAATIFVGCKKEKDEVAPNAKMDNEAQALLNRIEAFQTLRDAINSGAKADGSMTVEEMRQVLDIMSNYEHSEHMTLCLNNVLDTLCIAMPAIDSEGMVANADVVATYNIFEAALERCIANANDGKNVPSLFSIAMPNAGTKDSDGIKIVFNRGEESDDLDINYPFEKDYFWGNLLGLCDSIPFNIRTDAAHELTRIFVNNATAPEPGWVFAMTDVEYVVYTVYDDEYTNTICNRVYWEPSVTPPCADHWLFLAVGDFVEQPCIPWDEMNCYYNNINTFIVSESGELHYSPTYHSPYYECEILAVQPYYKRPVYTHVAKVTYCNGHWINPNPNDQ